MAKSYCLVLWIKGEQPRHEVVKRVITVCSVPDVCTLRNSADVALWSVVLVLVLVIGDAFVAENGCGHTIDLKPKLYLRKTFFLYLMLFFRRQRLKRQLL